MEFTEDQKRGFREAFANQNRTRVIITGMIVVLACLLGLAASFSPSRQMELTFVAVIGVAMLIAVVYLMRTSRCPACGRIVGRPMRARFCDQCGVPLR
jgi:1,4-dihydroxy-2-naphthoate octaprenyltransferase